jgi:3-methyl-2-oxobutanoate hydroxymethyltransferase
MVREGGAEAVKVEGGRKRLEVVEGILDAEIPVMGHLGLTPQSVHAMGGYKVQGKATEAARDLIRDAISLADAGVFAMVLEGVPTLVAEIITKEVSVPTIGIGAGSRTDGQVLVFHDVLGLHDGHLPKFVRQYARLQETAVEALADYFADVEKGTFPTDDESYAMSEEAARALLRDEPRGDAFDAF